MNDLNNDYYAPPKAVLESDAIDESVTAQVILNRLLNEQSFTRVFLFTFFGSLLGVTILALFLVVPGIFFLAFVLPGLITGLIVRFLGRALDVRYRLFSGGVALLMYWLLIEMLNPSSVVVAFLLSLGNAIVTAFVARRSLDPEEEAAIYYRRMGIARAPE